MKCHPLVQPRRQLILLGGLAGVILGFNGNALAVAFRLPNQDPEAIARGNAFAATADNPSAIYYNPAGITQLEGNHLRAGVYAVSGGVEYSSPLGKAKVDETFQPVPQVYYVYSPKDSDLSFGLGVYSPYGLSVDWGRNTPFNTLAENGKVLYACINPVIAWQVHPKLSLAIGPTINYSEAELEQAFPYFTPGGLFKFKGDGMAYGFNAGLRWQPSEHWAFGVNYRYETEVDYKGTSTADPLPTTSTYGPLVYPQFVVVGASYRPNTNWNFEVNVDWSDWQKVNAIVFNGTSIGTITLPLNLESSLMYEFGVTRNLGNGYFASVGYFYSENSSPDAYFNPILPDANLHLGSIGISHHGQKWDWALAYHFGYNGGRTVTGSPTSPAGQSGDGEYKTLNHALNLAVTFKF
jgi:long-chain fatty acid transport protein